MSGEELEKGVAELHRRLFAPEVVAARRGGMRRALKRLGERYRMPASERLPMVGVGGDRDRDPREEP